MVFKDLDDQSLINSREANREMKQCLNNERFYWIRIINKFSKNFEGHKESWKDVINKASIQITKKLAIATQEYLKNSHGFDVAPHHVAVEKGSTGLCEYIISKTQEKNPKGNI